MSNTCELVILTCEDFRLHQKPIGENKVAEFIKDLGKTSDLITRGGGIKDLVSPKKPGYRESVLRDLEVSVNLHEINQIYLVNHEECGGYREYNFNKREDELNKHLEDLKEAEKIIKQRFEDIDVKKYFAKKKKSGNFKIINVENK